MRIGQLADSCNCSPETIRYYEKIGLLLPAIRQQNGYRHYESSHQKWLGFILRSKALGFSQKEVRRLTDLANAPSSTCQDVHELILDHICDVRARLKALKKMEAALLRLEGKCIDETLHECPVIDELTRRIDSPSEGFSSKPALTSQGSPRRSLCAPELRSSPNGCCRSCWRCNL